MHSLFSFPFSWCNIYYLWYSIASECGQYPYISNDYKWSLPSLQLYMSKIKLGANSSRLLCSRTVGRQLSCAIVGYLGNFCRNRPNLWKRQKKWHYPVIICIPVTAVAESIASTTPLSQQLHNWRSYWSVFSCCIVSHLSLCCLSIISCETLLLLVSSGFLSACMLTLMTTCAIGLL